MIAVGLVWHLDSLNIPAADKISYLYYRPNIIDMQSYTDCIMCYSYIIQIGLAVGEAEKKLEKAKLTTIKLQVSQKLEH